MADAVQESQEPTAQSYNDKSVEFLEEMKHRWEMLAVKATEKLTAQGYDADRVVVVKYLNTRYE